MIVMMKMTVIVMLIDHEDDDGGGDAEGAPFDTRSYHTVLKGLCPSYQALAFLAWLTIVSSADEIGYSTSRGLQHRQHTVCVSVKTTTCGLRALGITGSRAQGLGLRVHYTCFDNHLKRSPEHCCFVVLGTHTHMCVCVNLQTPPTRTRTPTSPIFFRFSGTAGTAC